MTNLQLYHEWLSSQSRLNGRPTNPESFEFKTLWIPRWSGNRSATFDLNHEIQPDFQLPLIGYNGNCGTPYEIVEVPKWLTVEHLDELKARVAKALNKPEGYPVARVLKADERMPVILAELKNLIKEFGDHISIHGDY